MSAERLVSLSVTPPVDHEVTARLDGAGARFGPGT